MVSGSILKFYRGVWVYAISFSAILELVSTFQVSIMLWTTFVDSKTDEKCLENQDPVLGFDFCLIDAGSLKLFLGAAFFGINITFLMFRLLQLRSWALTGKYFLRRRRYLNYAISFTCEYFLGPMVKYQTQLTIDSFCLWFLTNEDTRIRIGIIVPLAYNGIFCTIELCMGEEFRVFMADIKINQAADFFVSADSTEHTSSSASLGQPISKEQSASAWQPPHEFDKAVLHWSKVSVDVPTDKALWMTMDGNNGDVASFVQDLLSPPNNNAYTGISLVDVSQTRSTLWPLIRGLLSASSQYKEEIAENPPTPLYEYFRRFPWRPSFRIEEELDVPPLNHRDTVDRMISAPLRLAHHRLNNKVPSHRRWAQLSLMPIALIIHGVRNAEQAEELYHLIETFKRGHGDPYNIKMYYKHIAIVVISSPELFRHLSYHHAQILAYTYTLYMSDCGAIIYSGNHYSSQRLEEARALQALGRRYSPNAWIRIREVPIFISLSVVLIGWSRLLIKYTQLGLLSAPRPGDVTSSAGPSTQSILKKLYELSEARMQILQGLSEIENIPGFRQNDKILLMNNVDKLNNVQTAEVLQQLFHFNSYREVIPNMDAKYASAALNLTTTMLAGGLPESITNQTEFNRRAERFRNWIARHLNQLPDELSISNIVQVSEFALKGGGFGDVYRGRYKNPTNGVQTEVAFKAPQNL
ncbi:hypothetical protein MSAN_01171900 [Mycena sanguinolenta]|uniref:Uncharacterized protein n=1 Tax=Mycena sanguinolenta TaxID=230812 RepID=A0A8H7D4Q6_9AGAR|nr:hypothetical protein MSAN_01171900 [Mycena sanguinolenta]